MNEPNTQSDLADQAAETLETANERFKRSFSSWFWGSITAAIALHFAVFEFWPSMQTADVSFTAAELEVVAPPPDVEIPPPPEAIRRPAAPVISTAAIDEDLTIEATTFEVWTAEDLPPPPEEAETANISDAPQFVVMTQTPLMLNQADVERAIEREYPALLKDAGISGTGTIALFIDEEGEVRDARLCEDAAQFCGADTHNFEHVGFKDAALKVATIARFSPAKNRDKTIAVWVKLDVTFTSN